MPKTKAKPTPQQKANRRIEDAVKAAADELVNQIEQLEPDEATEFLTKLIQKAEDELKQAKELTTVKDAQAELDQNGLPEDNEDRNQHA